jgi:phage-related protein
MAEPRKSRPVSWIKAALREFEKFPEGAQTACLAALTIAAEGGKADIAKPIHGLGSGVFEIGGAIQRGTPSERLKRLKEILQ